MAFIGRQVDRAVIDEVAGNGAVLTFEVDRGYKGEVPRIVQVRTHAQGSACGMDYGPQQVAVAATDQQGVPSVSLCRSFVTKADLVQVFGVGVPPLDAEEPGQPPDEESSTDDSSGEALVRSPDQAAGGRSSWPLLGLAILAFVVAGAGVAAVKAIRARATAAPYT